MRFAREKPLRRLRLIDTPWGRMSLTEAAERSGIDIATLHSRLKAGKDEPFRPAHGNTRHGRYSKRA
jgi:hypothetical protein